jgi:hypothetical protein
MPAMDFCNTMEFPIATLWIFNLQLSVFLSYNKQFIKILSLNREQIKKMKEYCFKSSIFDIENWVEEAKLIF